MKTLRHLFIFEGELFTRLKLVCIIKSKHLKNKSKFERPFDGDNGHFSCQESRKVQIKERIFPKGLENPSELKKFSNYRFSNYRKEIIRVS